jgi:hypothetical protein
MIGLVGMLCGYGPILFAIATSWEIGQGYGCSEVGRGGIMTVYRAGAILKTGRTISKDSAMTIQMLYERIKSCLEKLNKSAVLDEAVFELELLVMQLRIRMHAGVYDPSQKINDHNAPEVATLVYLMDEIDRVMNDAAVRSIVVAKLAATARNALRNQGIPFRA